MTATIFWGTASTHGSQMASIIALEKRCLVNLIYPGHGGLISIHRRIPRKGTIKYFVRDGMILRRYSRKLTDYVYTEILVTKKQGEHASIKYRMKRSPHVDEGNWFKSPSGALKKFAEEHALDLREDTNGATFCPLHQQAVQQALIDTYRLEHPDDTAALSLLMMRNKVD